MKFIFYFTFFLCGIIYSGVNAQCSRFDSISRDRWQALSPKDPQTILNNSVSYVFIQHTAGSSCNNWRNCSKIVQSYQNSHINGRGWNDIGYNFLIGGRGHVYVGRGWNVVGAHTYGFNSRSYGIAFIGNFNYQLPSKRALLAAKNLIQCGIKKGYLNKNYSLYAHRDASCTDSPGHKLYDVLKTWKRWHAAGELRKSEQCQ